MAKKQQISKKGKKILITACAVVLAGGATAGTIALTKMASRTPDEPFGSSNANDKHWGGVSFEVGGATTRIGEFAGKEAGINGAKNDFDDAWLYKDIKRETITPVAGKTSVVVEIPFHYVSHTVQWTPETDGTKTYSGETYAVANYQVDSTYFVPLAFQNADGTIADKYEIGAYKTFVDADGAAVSQTGTFPTFSESLEAFRAAGAIGGGHVQEKYVYDDVLELMMIEFGTKNLSSKFAGVYSNAEIPSEDVSGGYAVKNGLTDAIAASSGEVTTLGGKTLSVGDRPFVWRGIENVWGGVYEWLDGARVKYDADAKTATMMVCADPDKFAANTTASADYSGWSAAYQLSSTVNSGNGSTNMMAEFDDQSAGMLRSGSVGGNSSDQYQRGYDYQYRSDATKGFLYCGCYSGDSSMGRGPFLWASGLGSSDADSAHGARASF